MPPQRQSERLSYLAQKYEFTAKCLRVAEQVMLEEDSKEAAKRFPVIARKALKAGTEKKEKRKYVRKSQMVELADGRTIHLGTFIVMKMVTDANSDGVSTEQVKDALKARAIKGRKLGGTIGALVRRGYVKNKNEMLFAGKPFVGLEGVALPN